MIVKIAFFDKYVLEHNLINILPKGTRVISSSLCLCDKIRLRKIANGEIITFHKSKYISNKKEVCFGMVYTLEINDLHNILFSPEYDIDEIVIKTISCEEVFDLLNESYTVVKPFVKCYCFTAKKNILKNIYARRYDRVKFDIKLLLKTIKF